MAGLGIKTFGTEVLTSGEVNGYLMQQSVMTFDSDAARTSALTAASLSPAEGMVSYLKDTSEMQVYNGSAWIQIANVFSDQLMLGATRTGTGSADSTSPIRWNTLKFPCSHYNASTGNYTCPVPGKYFVSCHVITNSPGSFYLRILKNGAIDQYSHVNLSGTWAHCTVSGMVSCSTGDTIAIQPSAGIYANDHNGFAILYMGT